MSSSDLIPVTTEPHAVATPTPMHLIQMAMAKDFDIDKLERLLKFQQDSDARIAEQAFNAALCSAQSEIGRIEPNAKNESTRSNFAKIDKIDSVIRPVYIKHGFSISFDSTNHTAENIEVVAIVTHSAGHTKKYTATIPCDGKGAKGGDVMTRTHAMGSAMSYGRRYLLLNIFNIAVGKDDDDGNKSSPKLVQTAPPWTQEEVDEARIQLYTVAEVLLDKGIAEPVVNEAVARSKCAIDSGDCTFGTFINRINGMCGAMMARHAKENPDASAL